MAQSRIRSAVLAVSPASPRLDLVTYHMVDNGAMIREALSGQRIGITGATGFLGTALVERLLRTVPDCQLAVLVRPGQVATAERRARREILRNDCFDRLRSELGDRFEDEV